MEQDNILIWLPPARFPVFSARLWTYHPYGGRILTSLLRNNDAPLKMFRLTPKAFIKNVIEWSRLVNLINCFDGMKIWQQRAYVWKYFELSYIHSFVTTSIRTCGRSAKLLVVDIFLLFSNIWKLLYRMCVLFYVFKDRYHYLYKKLVTHSLKVYLHCHWFSQQVEENPSTLWFFSI